MRCLQPLKMLAFLCGMCACGRVPTPLPAAVGLASSLHMECLCIESRRRVAFSWEGWTSATQQIENILLVEYCIGVFTSENLGRKLSANRRLISLLTGARGATYRIPQQSLRPSLDSYIAATRQTFEGRKWSKALGCFSRSVELCFSPSYGTLNPLGRKKMLFKKPVVCNRHSTIYRVSSTPRIPRSASLGSWSHHKGRVCQHPRQIPCVSPIAFPCHSPSKTPQKPPGTPSSSPMASSASTSFIWSASSSPASTTGVASPKPSKPTTLK